LSSSYTIGMASNLDSFASAAPPSGTPPELFFYFLFVTYARLTDKPQFAITQISGDKKARRAKTGPLPLALEPQRRDLFPPGPGNPTFAVILQARPLPGALVRVEISSPDLPHATEDFDFAPALNQGQVTLALRRDQPPRLSVAVNTTFVARPAATGTFGNPGVPELRAVLRHIHDRLLEGPDAAWRGSDGSPELPFSPGAQDSDEESWAKLFTEQIIAAPYARPVTAYSHPGSANVSEDEVFLKYLDAADPAYGLCYECQHLVTMAALTRGIVKVLDDKDAAGRPRRRIVQFTAGSDSKDAVRQLGGRFLPSAAERGLVSDALDAGITPGSSWVYNGKEESGKEIGNQGGAHIAFALRVDLTGRRVQTFDTGGLNVVDRDTVLSKGTHDDPWLNATEHVPGPNGARKVYKGVCVLPAPPDLAGAVARMRRARPLGFARLVVMRRPVSETEEPRPGSLLYASPLLRMHHDGGGRSRNLSCAAYLWSLRDHPGVAELEATWLFYTPRSALALAAIHGSPGGPSPRQLTVAELVHAAKLKVPVTHALALAFGVADHRSREDGAVTVLRRYNQHADKMRPSKRSKAIDALPWGIRSGAISLSDADLGDLPYLRDG